MSEIDLLQTTDAAVWTDEFWRLIIDAGVGIDRGLMLSWFANAIETGRTAGEAA